MFESIKIELTPEAQQTLRAVQRLPDHILAGIAKAMDTENLNTVSHIDRAYLSFSKGEPPVAIGLRVQTNRGRNSMRASEAVIDGQSVVSGIGSNVKYMAVHEFGYQGEQHVEGHTRKQKSRNVVGRLGERKPRQVVAQGVAFVKPFTRNVNFPARAFTRRGIADRSNAYSQAISAAIAEAFKK